MTGVRSSKAGPNIPDATLKNQDHALSHDPYDLALAQLCLALVEKTDLLRRAYFPFWYELRSAEIETRIAES